MHTANSDADLACCKCGIPLLERQAVYSEAAVWCEVHAFEAEQRAIAEEVHLEERREEELANGQFGVGA